MDAGYYGRAGAVGENNVKLGVGACQAVMSSDLFLTKRLATLDACGIVQLDTGDFFRYQYVERSDQYMKTSEVEGELNDPAAINKILHTI